MVCLAVIFLLWIALHFNSKGDKINRLANDDVIALVDGTKILYKDVKVEPEFVKLGLTGIPLSSKINLSEQSLLYETKRLADTITKYVIEKNIKDLGISVSQNEINSRVDELFKKSGMNDNEARIISRDTNALFNALKECQKEPQKSDYIYKERLSGTSISKEQWKLFQINYNTPEKLKNLKIPHSIEDMKANSRNSAENDLLFQKLYDKITNNISLNENEIADFYKQKYSLIKEKPPYEEVKEELGKQLLNAKKEEAFRQWLLSQYRKIKIEIKFKQFHEAYKLLGL